MQDGGEGNEDEDGSVETLGQLQSRHVWVQLVIFIKYLGSPSITKCLLCLQQHHQHIYPRYSLIF